MRPSFFCGRNRNFVEGYIHAPHTPVSNVFFMWEHRVNHVSNVGTYMNIYQYVPGEVTWGLSNAEGRFLIFGYAALFGFFSLLPAVLELHISCCRFHSQAKQIV